MNLGWFEILDRISVLQSQLDESVSNHQEADEKLQILIDEAQEKLGEAYQYAGEMFYNSENEDETN